MVMNTSRAVLSLGSWIKTTQRLSRVLPAAGFVADSFASNFFSSWVVGLRCVSQLVFNLHADVPDEAGKLTGHRRDHLPHG
jgi:hypothetical protein